MAISLVNNLSMNRSDAAVADEVWTATSATLSDFQAISAGKIGQVVQTEVAVATASTTSGTFVDITGMTVTITPSASSSKILCQAFFSMGQQGGYESHGKIVRLISGGSDVDLCIGDAAGSRARCTWNMRTHDAGIFTMDSYNATILDSPSTTTSTSYRLQWQETEGTTLYLNRSSTDTDNANYPRGASTITVMEILA